MGRLHDATPAVDVSRRHLLLVAAVIALSFAVAPLSNQVARILLAAIGWIFTLMALHPSTATQEQIPKVWYRAAVYGGYLVGLVLFFSSTVYIEPSWAWATPATALAAVLASLGVVGLRSRQSSHVGWILVLIALGISLTATMLSTQADTTDVGLYQIEAVEALLDGENPYAITYTDPYPPDVSDRFYGEGVSVDGELQFGFPYMPLNLIAIVPFELIGDYRIAYILCFLGTATLLRSVGPRRHAQHMSAMFMLFTPAPFIVRHGWTDVLALFLLALAVWIFTRPSRSASWVTGLATAAKQYAIPFAVTSVPGLAGSFTLRRATWHIARAAALYVVIALPWVLWNPDAFYTSVIELQFRQPFRPDSISLPALAPDFYTALPRAFAVGVPLLLVVALSIVLAVRGPRGARGVALGSAAVFFTLFILSKQAFTNYYTIVLGLLWLALATHHEGLPIDAEVPPTQTNEVHAHPEDSSSRLER